MIVPAAKQAGKRTPATKPAPAPYREHRSVRSTAHDNPTSRGPLADSKSTPTEIQRQIADLIRASSRDHPIRADRICVATSLPERVVRKEIEVLRTAFGLPIGASKRGPAGFFWIRDKRDAEIAIRCYIAPARTTFKNLRRFIPRHLQNELNGQLRLALEEHRSAEE